MLQIGAVSIFLGTMELVSTYINNLLGQNADKIVVVESETGRCLTASDVIEQSERVSGFLSSQSLGADHVIAYFSSNCADFISVTLGILHTGAAVAFGNPNFTEGELSKFFSLVKPDAVVYNPKLAPLILGVGGRSLKCLSTSDLLLQRSEGFVSRPEKRFTRNKDHVAFILLSSGTTGFPKPAMLTHQALILQLKHGFYFNHENHKVLTVLPLYHIYGLLIAMVAMCKESSIVTMGNFKAALLVENIKNYQISFLPIVPSLLLPLLDCSAVALASLRYILTGGAPANESLVACLLDKVPSGSLEVYNIYGMTEASGIISFLKLSRDEKHHDEQNIGKVLPILEAKVVDPQGSTTPLPNNTSGELCLRGDAVFLGYRNNKQATEEIIDGDGWVHTGDLAYRNDEGCYFLVGRLKELIKYQGNQISPYEIESVCRQHPGVKEVTVLGIPHEIFGELPAAVVVPRSSIPFTAEDLKQFVEGQISPSKRLRGGVFLCSEDFIPRTASGKVKRNELLTKILETADIPGS